jgi:cytochrome P450
MSSTATPATPVTGAELRARLAEPLPLREVDLAALDNFTDGITPWRMFHTLRREDPVHWQPEEAPNSGFWAVTRHTDIARVDRDAGTFTSTRFVNLEEVDDDQIKKRASILELDGVRHRALRSLLQRQFGASVIGGYTDFLRGLTATTLDTALAKGTFDFVKEVSADFPINVLARLLDVPPEDNQRLIDWGNRIIGNTDPDYADVLLHSEESEKYRDLPFRSPASLEVFEYGRELARQRRGGDGTDLVSRLVNTTPRDGVPLTPQDFDNYFLLLVVAGNETTRHTITHSMLALLQHPEQLARLQEDPSLIPAAVEEFLRWASPVYHFRRTATRDVELGGRQIKEGDKVVMWFASGNRDEEVFGDPYDFDVTRTGNDHVTFGKGSPHLCLGNLLARTEIRVMFEELIPRIADVRLAGDVPRVRSNFVNGIKKLPVEVTRAR